MPAGKEGPGGLASVVPGLRQHVEVALVGVRHFVGDSCLSFLPKKSLVPLGVRFSQVSWALVPELSGFPPSCKVEHAGAVGAAHGQGVLLDIVAARGANQRPRKWRDSFFMFHVSCDPPPNSAPPAAPLLLTLGEDLVCLFSSRTVHSVGSVLLARRQCLCILLQLRCGHFGPMCLDGNRQRGALLQ